MQKISRTLVLSVVASPFAMAMFLIPNNGNVQPGHLEGSPQYLYQGWGKVVRQEFHYGPQGSDLIPYDWFLNILETGSETVLFKDDLQKFGVIYDTTAEDPEGLNPDHLPIGFAKHSETRAFGNFQEKKWMGLTCAACHTGAIVPKEGTGARIQGTIIVDGAPSGADFARFIASLRDAVQATAGNSERLKKFAQRVASMPNESSAPQVASNFKIYAAHMQNIFQLYIPGKSGGPGRLDCIGAIVNRVAYDIQSSQIRPANLSAPVNFPFLWYSDRQSKIQWNGTVGNGNWILRLSRNVGEVTGVFAQYEVKHNADLVGYKSSVNISGLSLLDSYLRDLTPPKFSDVFRPSISDLHVLEQARKRGGDIFKRTCQTSGCHANSAAYHKVLPVNPTPLLQIPNHNPYNLPDLDTDPNNTFLGNLVSIDSGVLAGSDKFFVPLLGKIKQREGGTALLAHLVIGSLLNQSGKVWEAYKRDGNPGGPEGAPMASRQTAGVRGLVGNLIDDRKLIARDVVRNLQAAQAANLADPRYRVGYESRALDGIWATAPYLHNGSVPNLHALLWPNERKAFYVGSRVYDPVLVGFVSDDPAQGVLFDPTLPGNSNKGHTYGANLTKDKKNDLMEFLKTL